MNSVTLFRMTVYFRNVDLSEIRNGPTTIDRLSKINQNPTRGSRDARANGLTNRQMARAPRDVFRLCTSCE
jgi:hypothetical protein